MSPNANCKVLIGNVEEAIKLGADAVSIHVNLGAEDEKSMLQDFGRIAREANEWGMPLLAMIYTRGPKVKSEYDLEVVKHAARWELNSEQISSRFLIPVHQRASERSWRMFCSRADRRWGEDGN